MRIRAGGGVVKYGLPGVVLGLLISSLGGAGGPYVAAQVRPGGEGISQGLMPSRSGDSARQQPARTTAAGEANGTLALVTNPTGLTQWLYLIDTKSRAFAVYRVDPSNPSGALKLEAARQYQWDLKLEHYNNQAPQPLAIEATVKNLNQSVRSPGDR